MFRLWHHKRSKTVKIFQMMLRMRWAIIINKYLRMRRRIQRHWKLLSKYRRRTTRRSSTNSPTTILATRSSFSRKGRYPSKMKKHSTTFWAKWASRKHHLTNHHRINHHSLTASQPSHSRTSSRPRECHSTRQLHRLKVKVSSKVKRRNTRIISTT